MAEQDSGEPKHPVLGARIELSNGRYVFVGSREGSESTFIGFRNAEGDVTRLAVSPEAASALHTLLGSRLAGLGPREAPPAPLVYRSEVPVRPMRWQVTRVDGDLREDGEAIISLGS